MGKVRSRTNARSNVRTIVYTIVLILICLAAAFAAVRFRQEANYGTGPMDSTGEPEGPAREIAFVANAVEGTVSLIDVQERKTVRTLTVIPDGGKAGFFRDPAQFFAQGALEGKGGLNYAQDTDLSRDGRVLFVSRGHLGDAAAFDLATGALLWRTPIAGIRADHMDISPDGRRLFVSAMIGGDVVEVLDSASGRRIGRFPTGRWPHDIHVSKDGTRVFVGSLGDMTKPPAERGGDRHAYQITVADARTLKVIEVHDYFTAGIRPFLISDDGRYITLQESNYPSVSGHALGKRDEAWKIVFALPEGVTESDWDFEAPHHGLARSDKGLCIAARATDEAILVRGSIRDDVSVPVGDAPGWAAVTSDGLCLLPNNRSDDVSFVSIEEAKEVARIPVGRGPKHITVGQVPVSVLERSVSGGAEPQ